MLCITDPQLGSIDDVIVLVFISARLQRESITPRLCFGEAEASDLFSGKHYSKDSTEYTAY